MRATELPLPSGERVGVRGSQAVLRLEQPLTPALSPEGRGSQKTKCTTRLRS
ncbi:hypothetical protein QFZ54_002209 [Sphingomonas faeni]|nr:hypothetical protein [Sphingomonas faeni]